MKRIFKSKYKNKSRECLQGHWHHSTFEARYCDQLALLVKANEIKSYETQKKFSLDVNGVHISNHYVDFLVTTNEDKLEIHETKGFATQDWLFKKRLTEALYPDIPYIVVVKAKEGRFYARSYQKFRKK